MSAAGSTPVKATETKSAAAAPGGSNKLSQLFKTDKWNCTGCYAPNNKDDLKCMCCGTFKPGHTEADLPKTESKAAPSGGMFSFGMKTADASQAKPDAKAPFSFGMKPADANQAKPDVKAPFSFGTLAKSAISPAKTTPTTR